MLKKLSCVLTTLVLMSGVVLTSPDVQAEPMAPTQQKNAAPGYYRMMLGGMEITAIYDSSINLEDKSIKGIQENAKHALFEKTFVDEAAGIPTAVNAYLINTGAHLVLVDTGMGACMPPIKGALKENIRAAGYTPEQVDAIFITHLHFDHVCGIVDDGKMAFPNADIYVSKQEADYWLDAKIAAAAVAAKQQYSFMFAMAKNAVRPYQQAGRLKLYSYQPGEILLPGVELIPTPGHTPGHAAYLFSSQGKNLLLWGDVVHNHSVQFADTDAFFVDFDTNLKQAIAARKKVFSDAAKEKYLIASPHMPFPGLGHVRAEGKGYVWVPVEYSQVNERAGK